jgi:prepilin-type N-terminal cleavage/methylation domain-containing protein
MKRRTRAQQAGFTLLEVMLALGILFTALTVLIHKTAQNIRSAERADMLGVATNLSRAKMYDIEEELLRDGFQELDQEDEGEFDDEGFKQIAWSVKIEKIELPALGSLEALGAAGEGEEGGEGAAGGIADSPLAGLIAMGGGDASAASGASFISGQFELISQVLESSIRKVTLTVTWQAGGREEELVTTAYFTDPAAVQRALGGLGGGGATAGDDGGDDGTTPSTNMNRNPGNNRGSRRNL